MSSDPAYGRIKVMLTDENGTRTLLSAHGPGKYSYGLSAAFWAPSWQWIAADDGRILVITTAEPAVTRVLTDRASSGGGVTLDDERFSSFAVTEANLLAPAEHHQLPGGWLEARDPVASRVGVTGLEPVTSRV